MTSLYDYLKAHGESGDVWDTTFDAVVCWDIPDPYDRDDWAKVSRFLLKNIEYVRGEAPYDIVADKTGFVKNHIPELKKISSMYFYDEYQVKGTDINSLYWGVMMIDGMQTGDFPDEGYAKVVEIFGLNKPKKSAKKPLKKKTIGKSAKAKSNTVRLTTPYIGRK